MTITYQNPAMVLRSELSDAFAGQFMQPVIEQGAWFEVETSEGTEYVPVDVCGISDPCFPAEALCAYLSGQPLETDEPIAPKFGWLARLSASGYMDCTDWSAHQSWDAAARHLIDTYAGD